MAPVVVGSATKRCAMICSAGRLALASITAEKQDSTKAATQRAPRAVRIVCLDMPTTLGAIG